MCMYWIFITLIDSLLISLNVPPVVLYDYCMLQCHTLRGWEGVFFVKISLPLKVLFFQRGKWIILWLVEPNDIRLGFSHQTFCEFPEVLHKYLLESSLFSAECCAFPGVSPVDAFGIAQPCPNWLVPTWSGLACSQVSPRSVLLQWPQPPTLRNTVAVAHCLLWSVCLCPTAPDLRVREPMAKQQQATALSYIHRHS